MSIGKTSTSSAALAASERSGEAANAAGTELPAPRPLVSDSEVVARPHRRRFSAEYKLSIIEQADSVQSAGAVGGLLRREGLYSSHLATWRQQRKQGEFDALTAKKRGPKVVVSVCHECGNRNVVFEMVEDPPESIYRDWFQTAVCG